VTDRTRTIILATLGGIIAGLVIVLLVVVFTAGDDDPVANTTIGSTTSTTTAPPTTVVTPTTVTTPPSSTTTHQTTTTTLAPPGWGTSTQTNTVLSGSPGPNLTDVRVGDHATFTRVVFDFTGDGVPLFSVGYSAGPTFSGSGGGDAVSVDGNAHLTVNIYPAITYDIDTYVATYTGPNAFDPGLGPIAEIAFVDDFEADMLWVIGLTDQKGFEVTTLTGPVRLVIDIEH